ncbi:hypothetical protein [Methanobrevibacter sp. UBA313]|uniref:hypothetical protein n=1 Tax=Methanobrevibacter sp. UBA313 TaxID=1915477 RepID=UPI0039B82C52
MVELNKDSILESFNEMEQELRLYPIEEGLEDDIISVIKGKELSSNEKFDLDSRIEEFFYGAGLKCRKETYFFDNGFEFYVTELEIDLRKLVHIRDSFPKFDRVSVTTDMDQGFSTLAVKFKL